MKAAVALVCSVAVLAGCFPNDPQKRTYAKYVEGGAVVLGIGISAVVNTGADCDSMATQGPHIGNDCRTKAAWLGTTGLLLILGGLLGFVATISTAEDAVVQKEKKESMEHPVPKEEVKLPPGVGTKANTPAAHPAQPSSGSAGGPAGAQTPEAPPPGTGSGAPPT